MKLFTSILNKNKQKEEKKANCQKNTSIIKTQLYFTDKYGNNWYKYQNTEEIPACRTIIAEISQRQAEMCVKHETLNDALDLMIQHGNKGNIVDLFYVIRELKARINMAAESKTLEKLATVYFLLNDENPEKYEKDYQDQKNKLWQDDIELQGFFLQSVYNLITNYTATSSQDIKTYLMEHSEDLTKLERMIKGSKETSSSM